jgi:DNA-binding transcriptional LysR family regulator
MMDWDDIRYFLAVARGGSVRAAAQQIGVNHSTVLRRIAQLEERLGAHMFVKLPSGYRLTNAAEEVLEFAEQMEASSNQMETRVFGRDQGICGLLRVTLAPILATHLLMPDFAEFARLHTVIEMEILPSDEPVNLTNRPAVRLPAHASLFVPPRTQLALASAAACGCQSYHSWKQLLFELLTEIVVGQLSARRRFSPEIAYSFE